MAGNLRIRPVELRDQETRRPGCQDTMSLIVNLVINVHRLGLLEDGSD